MYIVKIGVCHILYKFLVSVDTAERATDKKGSIYIF